MIIQHFSKFQEKKLSKFQEINMSQSSRIFFKVQKYCSHDVLMIENFIEQVNLAKQLTSADFSVATALFSQEWWQMFRSYILLILNAQQKLIKKHQEILIFHLLIIIS